MKGTRRRKDLGREDSQHWFWPVRSPPLTPSSWELAKKTPLPWCLLCCCLLVQLGLHTLEFFPKNKRKDPSLSILQSKWLTENFKIFLPKVTDSYIKTLIKLECSRNEVIWLYFFLLEFFVLKLKCTGIFSYFSKYNNRAQINLVNLIIGGFF